MNWSKKLNPVNAPAAVMMISLSVGPFKGQHSNTRVPVHFYYQSTSNKFTQVHNSATTWITREEFNRSVQQRLWQQWWWWWWALKITMHRKRGNKNGKPLKEMCGLQSKGSVSHEQRSSSVGRTALTDLTSQSASHLLAWNQQTCSQPSCIRTFQLHSTKFGILLLYVLALLYLSNHPVWLTQCSVWMYLRPFWLYF